MQVLYDIPAPAKLNLFLHVVGRRADGYHLLQSVFALIDWCDTLHVQLRRDGLLSREDLSTPLPPDDLSMRAARALQKASATPLGAHIGLHKRVPSEAGMGGGSSDAASCLLALNRLWKLRLSLPQLCRIGARLGADVPFFLCGRNAWVEGIGDVIRPIDLPSALFMVVKPPQGLATAAIFQDPGLKRDSETATITGFADDPYGYGRNDLQPVAQRLCPGVVIGLEWLQSRGLRGRMTGSGSAVFAPAGEKRELGDAPAGFQQRWCAGLDVHPLAGWADSDDLPVPGFGLAPV